MDIRSDLVTHVYLPIGISVIHATTHVQFSTLHLNHNLLLSHRPLHRCDNLCSSLIPLVSIWLNIRLDGVLYTASLLYVSIYIDVH